MIGDPHVPRVALPRMFAEADSRCEERCLATQHGAMSGNDLVAVLMHLAVDPDCEHCNARPEAETVYSYIAQLVAIARKAGPR